MVQIMNIDIIERADCLYENPPDTSALHSIRGILFLWDNGVKLRTCPHRVNVRIFRHNFVGGKAKIRRRAVALQGFLTQSPAKFDEKTCMNPYVDRFLDHSSSFLLLKPDLTTRPNPARNESAAPKAVTATLGEVIPV